jgi:thioredoxin 1
MQAFFIFVVVLVVAFLILNIYARIKMKNMPEVSDHAAILTLTDQNFDTQTAGKIVLVDFWASWCAPCRMMAPVLNEVSDELGAEAFVGKIDIQQYQSMAQRFNVRNIPTMILFKNGKEVNRFVGVKQKDFLLNEIRKVK